ncbi:iqgap-related protein [Microsporum audouinii]
MSSPNPPSLRRRGQSELAPASYGPLRHGSTASTNSSLYSMSTNSYVPSRTSTVSSHAPSDFMPETPERKIDHRGRLGSFDTQPSAGETYGSIRRSLRPLPQAPNSTPPKARPSTSSSCHGRSQTMGGFVPQPDFTSPYSKPLRSPTPEFTSPFSKSLNSPSQDSTNSIIKEQDEPVEPRTRSVRRSHHSRTQSTPHAPSLQTSFTAPELQTFKKSTTGHLRTLSQIAQSDSDEFAIATASPSVVGLQGRRRLKRADSVRAGPKSNATSRPTGVSAWTASNWMDKQRRFLQAYEYLCHIGEAKEWIEDVIQKPIPPIVQLEEALRDGVTLAELVQALYPHRTFRIFYSPKLQFRHSDNIALFFRFLDEIELPEVFRFELIDLYERKNIPKVIHCIHALSWLLFKNGVVDFRIGNLVGQLEFEHHELEQTQRGLDQAGVPMPSFSGMGAKFGAEPEPEPEPEPVETEEEKIARELNENETSISDLQTQARGALLRLRLGELMQELWGQEHLLIDLQSRIRGDWARQIAEYRLSMQKFATDLQSAARGFIIRLRQKKDQSWCKAAEQHILQFQSLVRAKKAKSEVQLLHTLARKEEHGIKSFQAAIRGALARKYENDRYEETKDAEGAIQAFQSAIRGMLLRRTVHLDKGCLEKKAAAVTDIQSIVRAMVTRNRIQGEKAMLASFSPKWLKIQSAVRANATRSKVEEDKAMLAKFTPNWLNIQSIVRANAIRNRVEGDKTMLTKFIPNWLDLQSIVRANATRSRVESDKAILARFNPNWLDLQSIIRANASRSKIERERAMLANFSPNWLDLQSISRAIAVRRKIEETKKEFSIHEASITDLQGFIRGQLLRANIEACKSALVASTDNITLIQSSVRGFLLRQAQIRDMEALLEDSEIISRLQGLARAAMLRIDVGDLLSELDAFTNEITQLQALSRAVLVRADVDNVLGELEAEEDMVMELQSLARASMVRQHFAEKQRFYRENMEKVIKVQSFVRGKIQGQAYKSLTSGKNPPVGTIKGFVHLLNDSDFDFDEELEFERLRKTVVQQVRQNEMADQYITQLDIKIALLVKNKITLDEVIKHQKHFGGHVGTVLSNSDIASKDPFDLKALNKTSRKKLEHYQELFFILQTQPQYLARVFRRLREQAVSERDCDRIKHLVMGLFGYSQKRREEYYLIKLIVRSVKEEIDHSASLQDYIRCNAFWTKLLAAYIKTPRDRKFTKDLFGPLVKEAIIDNVDLDLESDPMQIYRSAINNEELRTGKRSRRRPDVPREEAIRDPETRETFIRHLQDLRDIVDQVLALLEDSLHRLPFGIRFIAQQMYEQLLAKYEEEDRGYILQLVGQWVWKSYLQPALLDPERSGVVERALTQEQKRNLGEIGKVMGQAASGRLFGAENVYLQPLNTYIGESIQRLGGIWGNIITVQDAEAFFDINEYNDLYAKTKPTLYIKMSDIFSIHQLIAAEAPYICTSPEDTLREVIRDLGSVKSNENELLSVSSSEISLTLTPKLHNMEDPDAEIKALLVETKRCILYIIRVQSGANLLEILVTPPSIEDEERWADLVRDELSTGNRKRGAYSDTNTLIDIGAMSYTELKRTALQNIVELEKAGRISRHNQYQDLLNEIAVDIRTKHRRRIQRQRELENVRLTLDRLNDQSSYLEVQLKTYNDYIEQAMITLQNKKGKKRFLMPFTKQWDHERELQRSGRVFKFGSYKYSARNLADKGVLVHWKGYTERQWDRVDLTISSNAVGIFTIDGSSGNMMVPGANAQVPLDDLLQAQFNNTQFMDLFEDQLRVNVNLFLHLIMRKFYNE